MDQDRVVLLGASNLALSLATAVETARAVRPGPNRFLVACGFGRSYGVKSRVMWRALPGIGQCGLWRQLDGASVPTFALITDIGNDILYGYDADTILSWVAECIVRLREHDARIVITLLPAQSIGRLTPGRFRFVRSVLYPKGRVTLDEVIETVHRVNDGLGEMVGEHVSVMDHEADWYGFDPIHIRRRFREKAYRRFMSAWVEEEDTAQYDADRISRWKLACARPETRWIYRVKQHRIQPAATLPDGSTVSVY